MRQFILSFHFQVTDEEVWGGLRLRSVRELSTGFHPVLFLLGTHASDPCSEVPSIMLQNNIKNMFPEQHSQEKTWRSPVCFPGYCVQRNTLEFQVPIAPYTDGGNANGCNYFRGQFGKNLTKLNIYPFCQILHLGICPIFRIEKIYKEVYTVMFSLVS